MQAEQTTTQAVEVTVDRDTTTATARWSAVFALAKRELVRFVRQRNRVFGALVQPLIFWGLFGVGLSASFQPLGADSPLAYVEYFFPGTVVLIVLFTAIFATISIIEDRNEGLLQSVLVAPIPASSIVYGKLLGTTVLAVGQGALIFVLAPLAGFELSLIGTFAAFFLLIVIAFALSGLGFAIAWRMDSTQGFHAIMMAFLMPMWFLSGAFFPPDGMPTPMRILMQINPLTYALAALRQLLYLDRPEVLGDIPGLGLSLVVTLLFAASMTWLATAVTARSRYVS